MGSEGGAEGIERVRSWIRETGYPLEYATARCLQKSGFKTFQGMHYVANSGEGAKSREIDVVAHVPIPQQGGPIYLDDAVAIQLVVECKVLRFPWVVLTRESTTHPANLLEHAIASTKAREGLKESAAAAGAVPDILVTPQRFGFSVVEARIPSATARRSEERKREDERVDGGYVALAQVTSAARGLRSADKYGWAFYWPVVVVRGALFQLGYDEGGEEVLEPVEWQRVLWAGHSDGPTHVDLVRERHLDAYASCAMAGLKDCGVRLASLASARATKQKR